MKYTIALVVALFCSPLLADHPRTTHYPPQYRRGVDLTQRYQYRYPQRPQRVQQRYRVVYQGNDGQRLTVITMDTYTGQLSRREFRVNAFDKPQRRQPQRRQPAYNPGRTGPQVLRQLER
jgi:hypothetical protein